MYQLVETKNMTQLLNTEAIEMEDFIEIRPLSGKKQVISLKRTQFDLVSFENIKRAGKFYKELTTFKDDSIFVRIERVLTDGIHERIVIKSLNGRAFYCNNSLILSAVLKNGDECDIGHNVITFRKKQIEGESNLVHYDLLQNKNILNSDMSILLEGETGSGKTSLAKKIHEYSTKSGSFVHINLSAFSESLLESELFGHIKGAFTGASQDKLGALRQANKGTLFLDEIDSIPISIQTKLLLFLDNGKIRPVGGHQDYQVDCRMIFASGSQLVQKVKESKMRADFYFRLNSGYTYKLKDLRSNPDLIKNFCEKYSTKHGYTIDCKLIDFYQTLPWPGNFRQLIGHLDRKRVLCNSKFLKFDQYDDDLIIKSSELSMLKESDFEFITMQEMREIYAKKVYYKFDQNYNKAAKVLGISARSLKKLIM